jgi:predicted MPP superfamily phosphohydrolase
MLQKLQNRFGKRSARRIIIVAAIIAIFAVILVIALDSRLTLRYYQIDTPKITAPVRIALVTDLHSCYYGEGQQDLIRAIEAQAPDLLLLAGDIFDDEVPDTNTECFLAGIAGKYPCYYVTGNHEYWSGTENFHKKMSILEKYGVTILSDSCEKITVNGTAINICGVNDPDSYMVEFDREQDPQGYENARNQKIDNFKQQLKALKAQAQQDAYTILLSHRPEHFEDYADNQFDLVLCGHAHGGQWRIPGLLNGLYAPNQGLFPSYAGGKYVQGSTTMIVSRGLARESTSVPRIFNPPELVVITLR